MKTDDVWRANDWIYKIIDLSHLSFLKYVTNIYHLMAFYEAIFQITTNCFFYFNVIIIQKKNNNNKQKDSNGGLPNTFTGSFNFYS